MKYSFLTLFLNKKDFWMLFTLSSRAFYNFTPSTDTHIGLSFVLTYLNLKLNLDLVS